MPPDSSLHLCCENRIPERRCKMVYKLRTNYEDFVNMGEALWFTSGYFRPTKPRNRFPDS